MVWNFAYQRANFPKDEDTDIEASGVGSLDEIDDESLQAAERKVGNGVQNSDPSLAYRHQ